VAVNATAAAAAAQRQQSRLFHHQRQHPLRWQRYAARCFRLHPSYSA
jgi:hypothetical protein